MDGRNFDLREYATSHKLSLNDRCLNRSSSGSRRVKFPPINKSICAPGTEGGEICYNKDQLLHIIRAYNEDHVDKIDTRGSKAELWKNISAKMTSRCNGKETQVCVLEQDFARKRGLDKLKNTVLKPERPLTQWAWLKTSDIFDVLKQYEQAYDNYVFLGTVPMDFCNITPNGGVCGVNLKKAYQNNKRKLGAVFNTDPSTQPGQHWVSMFIDLDEKTIDYYDSFGKVPLPPEIIGLIKILRSQEDTIPGGSFKVRINTCRHQQNNSECGVYSVNFIVERLSGKSWEEIMDDRLLDNEINERRNYYFR